jgi:hypothetical protein
MLLCFGHSAAHKKGSSQDGTVCPHMPRIEQKSVQNGIKSSCLLQPICLLHVARSLSRTRMRHYMLHATPGFPWTFRASCEVYMDGWVAPVHTWYPRTQT